MKALTAVILSVVFLLAAAVAQSGGGAAGNASGQGSTSATQGAQAQANTSAQAAAEAPAVPSGTRIPAVLTKSVDAKKAKQGDPVEAKTSEKLQLGSGTSLPKGTKLVGHVTEAKAKAKDKGESQSLLGIMFDKAVLKGGQEVPMHAIIQAAAALQQSSSLPDTMGSAGPGASAGGPYGGAQGGMGPAGAPGGPGGVSATMGPPAGPRTGWRRRDASWLPGWRLAASCGRQRHSRRGAQSGIVEHQQRLGVCLQYSQRETGQRNRIGPAYDSAVKPR